MVSNDTHRPSLEGMALGFVISSMYGHCPNLCSIGGRNQLTNTRLTRLDTQISKPDTHAERQHQPFQMGRKFYCQERQKYHPRILSEWRCYGESISLVPRATTRFLYLPLSVNPSHSRLYWISVIVSFHCGKLRERFIRE